jgi:hypothetical protein
MLADQVDHHIGMNMIHTDRMFQYNHECIKPINHLLHKFINVGPTSQDQNINIQYEVFDTYKSEQLIHRFRDILRRRIV